MSETPPSIMYVITDLEVGGVPLHLHRLTLTMRDRGYRPSVVSLAPPGPVEQRLQEDGIPVESCHACCGWDLRVIPRLARLVKTQQPDILHSFLFHANLAVRLAAPRACIPIERILCEIQTVEVERGWHLTVDRWTHTRCHLTIGNSPSVIEHLATRARIPQQRLRLVRGGIDPSQFHKAVPLNRSALGIDEKASIVFWAGRLDPIKGLDHLVDAFRRLVSDNDAVLLLAGDGEMMESLLRRIDRLGLRGRVHLLGSRSDIPSLLKTADLFVFPSRTEGLPNALLEAMVCGCPIVTTDVPGCRDLIRHEETGLLVRYADVAGLATAMHRMLADRTAALHFGQRAAEEVIDKWHIDATYDAYAALYEEMLAD